MWANRRLIRQHLVVGATSLRLAVTKLDFGSVTWTRSLFSCKCDPITPIRLQRDTDTSVGHGV
jgi:hypothetical protein